MKSFGKALLSAAAIAACVGLAGAASAQVSPNMMSANQLRGPAMPPWSQDDGSSSDHPIPMPGDISGDALNSQYQGGIDVPPPNGFPAPYRVR